MNLRALKPLFDLRFRLARRHNGPKPDPSAQPALQRSCELRERIEGELPRLETLFVQISEELSILDTHCQSMLKQCDELRALASGEQQGQSLVEDIRGLLQEPLAYIDECIASQAHLLNLVGQCNERTASMLRVRARMNDALSPLAFMTVLFKIESAYLHEDQRDTFITVTVEIDKLRSLVEETFRKNSELLESAQSTLQTMHGRLKVDFARQEALVGSKRQQISHAFDNLDKQVATNATRDNNMHAISSQLADEVSKVVMGLQFQDIFKQKCEQVLRGLQAYESSFGEGSGEDVSKLCSLDNAAAELDGGIGSVRTGVNLIQSHMEELESHSLNQDDQGSEGLVQVLLDTIEDVHEIITGMARLAEDAHTAVKPAGQIALSMSSALTELAINMQHIALNAQIRSVWIGEGTGLEQLAARTAEISNQISHISEQTTQDLGFLQQAVNEMLTAFEAFHRRGSDQLTRLNTQRTGTESRLHSLRDHTISTIHTIGSGVDAIKTSAGKLNEDLVQMDEVRTAVMGNARDLASFLVSRDAKPRSTTPPSATTNLNATSKSASPATDEFQDFSDFSPPTDASPAEQPAKSNDGFQDFSDFSAQASTPDCTTTVPSTGSPASPRLVSETNEDPNAQPSSAKPWANETPDTTPTVPTEDFTDFAASESPSPAPATEATPKPEPPAPKKPAPPATDFELF